MERVFATCVLLSQFPHFGSPRRRFGVGLRAWQFPPYVIYYRVDDGFVTVVRILHERQDAARIFGVAE